MFVEYVVRDVVDVCEKGCVLENLGWTFGGREGGAGGVVMGDGCERSGGSSDRGVRETGMPGARVGRDEVKKVEVALPRFSSQVVRPIAEGWG